MCDLFLVHITCCPLSAFYFYTTHLEALRSRFGLLRNRNEVELLQSERKKYAEREKKAEEQDIKDLILYYSYCFEMKSIVGGLSSSSSEYFLMIFCLILFFFSFRGKLLAYKHSTDFYSRPPCLHLVYQCAPRRLASP